MEDDRETILVVDDESVVLSLIQAMLAHQGYKVVTASGGHEALLLLENWPDLELDLVLIDVVMPDMGGIETIQHLRRLRRDLRVLLMSGYADHRGDWPEDARTLPLISKPFTAASLARKIRETLGSGQSAHA